MNDETRPSQVPSEIARAWTETAAASLNAAWPFDEHDPATWPASARLLPYLKAAVAAAAQENLITENVLWLNSKAGSYLYHTTGEPDAARPYLEHALDILTTTGHDAYAAIVRRNLADMSAET